MNDSILVRFEHDSYESIEPMKFQFRPVVGETICFGRKTYQIYKIEHIFTSGSAMISAKESEL